MPRVKPEERKRARRPKTRTGCRTCKIRRVKCDENKPECNRCRSTGRKCDGYDAESTHCQQLVQCVDILSGVFKSAKERRAFQYFQERTCQQIAGLSEFDFWNRTILQAIFTEPGIRCAIVAFGCLHEGFEKTGNTRYSHDEFALQQYNAAIRHHIDGLEGTEPNPDQVDSYVASCMVFVCIEILQGHYQSALSLVKGAVRLFYQCTESLARRSAWPLATLENLLSRLQSQAVGLIGSASVGSTVPPRLKAASFPTIPKEFSHPEQAKEYLEFYSHVHALTSGGFQAPVVGKPGSSEFQGHLSILSQWSAAFESMIASQQDTFSEAEQRTVNILRIWQIMTATAISMHIQYESKTDDQTLWDHFVESYKQVVALSEKVLKSTMPHVGHHREPTHHFTLDVCIVGPLYDTARICRDPLIRRKAINLLRQYPCREGLWDGLLAARAAERQMEIEESAVPDVTCAADVPGWARVTSVLPTFHLGERWAEVIYIKQKQPGCDQEPETLQERFEW